MASRANGLAAGIRGEGPANGAPQSSRRLALLLSYDGAAARGWTSLRDEVLRPALCKVLRQPDADLLVTAASRTDAGVHARGQVCSVDAARPLDAAQVPQLVYSLNQLLPEAVFVREGALVGSAFDVRANVGKEYRYTLSTAPGRDPLRRLHEWQLPARRSAPAWDVDAARKASGLLRGTHSYAALGNTPRGAERKVAIDPLCTLQMVQLRQLGPSTFQFRLRGDRFLYKMCRNVVGALVRVGAGQLGAHELEHALAHGEFARSRSVPLTAPAHGLVLHRVLYDRSPFASDTEHGLQLPATTTAATAAIATARTGGRARVAEAARLRRSAGAPDG